MVNLDQYKRKPKINLEQYRRQKSEIESEPEDNENLLQKIVRYGLKDPAIGILNMGREFANLPNKLSGGHIPEFSPSDFNFGEALGVEKPKATDKLIQFAGQYGPSLAIPGVGLGRAGQALNKVPVAGKYLSKAVSEAIPQGLYSAVQAPQDSLKAGAETGAIVAPLNIFSELIKGPSKNIRRAAQLGAGGLTGFLGRETAKSMGFGEAGSDLAAIAAGALGMRGFGTIKEMRQKLTEGVNPQLAEERLKAAEMLGIDYLTPAEAGANPWTSRQQGTLGRTSEGGKLLYEKGMKRQESERKAISKTLDMIYNEAEMEPQINAAYRSMRPVNLPTDFPVQYHNNAVIKAAEKRVKKSPAYKESLKKYLPENVTLEEFQSNPLPTSMVYWDHVKRALYDMGEEASRKGSGGEANIYNETRKNLVSKMDEAYPEYAEARGLYERKKVREGLEKVFDRKKINGTNFYKALASESKFEELMSHLRNAPEAQENLKAMRKIFDELMPPPTIKTAKGTEERGMNMARNEGDFLKSLFEHIFTGGNKDVKAIEFITSKDWLNQMKELEKISDKQLKLSALGILLSRGVGQYAGKKEHRPMELELIGGSI